MCYSFVGYITTIFLVIGIMALGVFVMSGSEETFSTNGGIFANQLIKLYTSTIGESVFIIIAIAAFTTMFSTTITCLDASPRTLKKTFELLKLTRLSSYRIWIIILAAGTLLIFIFLPYILRRVYHNKLAYMIYHLPLFQDSQPLTLKSKDLRKNDPI